MTTKSKQLIYIFLVIILLSNISFAQSTDSEGDEIRSFPWESISDYTYFEDASLFWNLNYRSGTGKVSLNAFELIDFEATNKLLHYINASDASILQDYDVHVRDYVSGISFSGIVHKYFSFKIEGGTAYKYETIYELDVDSNRINSTDLKYNLDLTFQAELGFGLPLNKDFTLVGLTSFRVWSTRIEDYKTYKEYESAPTEDIEIDIDTEVYIFKAQMQLYFEVFTIEKRTSLDIYAGMGVINYVARQLEHSVEYQPESTDRLNLITGAVFIYDEDYMLELKINPVGVFSIQLVFSYLI